MERLEAAMVVHVAYCRSSKGKYFYDVTFRDMDGWYHHFLLRPEKVKEIQKEWGVQSALYFLGRLALLQDNPDGQVATLMQTKPYNLGHHNDNNIYSLVDSKVCWELGSDGT